MIGGAPAYGVHNTARRGTDSSGGVGDSAEGPSADTTSAVEPYRDVLAGVS